ncbi:MAG: hypothetical protein DRP87_16000 [Spirochaetes bacterium]|nr:MAG: hypothetical protein DRP87_16000 [Spirochaetota bacterium]
MRFWDSSAILPLLVEETDTERRKKQLIEDPLIVVWWGSKIECVSTLDRLLREGVLQENSFMQIVYKLETLASSWVEIQAT